MDSSCEDMRINTGVLQCVECVCVSVVTGVVDLSAGSSGVDEHVTSSDKEGLRDFSVFKQPLPQGFNCSLACFYFVRLF